LNKHMQQLNSTVAENGVDDGTDVEGHRVTETDVENSDDAKRDFLSINLLGQTG
jgi:hypothetical protein